jgi:hypothetical protein
MRAILGVCLFAALLPAAANRDPGSIGEHVIAVVPLIGAGTVDDPRRPMFIPKPSETSAALAEGRTPELLAFHFVVADDGKTAIVEYVAPNRAALQPILEAASAGTVTAFEPRKRSLPALILELRRAKANFDWAGFRGIPQASITAQQTGGAN